MELALRWFGVGEGDEVIVPAYTFAATANVVIHCGAKPVMVDVDPNDFNMDPARVARAVSPRTKAIIPVDFGGMPCNYAGLINAVNAASGFAPANPRQEKLGRILILTDAAHSLGSTYDGAPAALQADFTAFSFHAVKNLTTAEGGALCIHLPEQFDASEVHRWFALMSLFGQTKDALAKQSGGSWEYDISACGYKCNMPDVLAAIGLVELGRYESDMLPKRRHITSVYDRLLGDEERFELPLFVDERRTSSYHLYPLRIRGIDAGQRKAIITHAHGQGVDLNVHFKPLPLMSYYRSLGYRIEDFPVSADSYSREVSLPVYYDLKDEMIERVVAVVRGAFKAVT
jgi:dTDP-4-amino-4,6-dideoxygalactose transaminase